MTSGSGAGGRRRAGPGGRGWRSSGSGRGRGGIGAESPPDQGQAPPPAAAGSGHPAARGSAAASCLTTRMGHPGVSGQYLTFSPGRVVVAGDQTQALVRHDVEGTCHVSTEAIPGVTSED